MDVARQLWISDRPWFWARKTDRIPYVGLESPESGPEEIECIAPFSVGRTAFVGVFELLDGLAPQEC